MAERITRVILEAEIGRFEQNMDRAAGSVKRVKAEGDKLAETHQAMTTVGTAGAAMGAAIAAGVGVAVAKFGEFDQQMSYVAAATHETAENMELLRQASLDAGASTVFSATEAAQAVEELSKAGVDTADILGGALTGSMDLAAAGGLDVARAAEISATALQQFQLDGSEASHVADVLAAGAGKAMGSVEDLANGLKFVGPVSAAMGVSLEETTAVLALFAQQGIIGEQAGTSLRGVLLSLTAPSSIARNEMERLGLTLYDSAGNFLGLENAAGQLQDAYGKMDGASRDASLGLIFGNAQVTAATALYKGGASGVAEWTEKVNDSGYAAETAAMRLDNLIGDWEALTGALDTAFITMGEGLDGPLRGLVQGLAGMVDGFNELPDGGKQAVLWIGLVTAGVGLLGGGALIAIPKLAALRIAMETLSINAASTRAGLARFTSFLGGPWGIAMIAATTAVVGLTIAQEKLRTSTEVFQNVIKNADSAEELFNAGDSAVPFLSRLKEATATAATFKENLDIISNNDFLRGLRRETSQLAATLTTMGEELGKVAESDAPAAARSFKMLSDKMELSRSEQIDLLNAMKPYRDELVKLADAAGVDVTTKEGQIDMSALLRFATEGTTAATVDAATATGELEAAAADAVGELDDMRQALDEVAGAALTMAGAHDDALGAINTLRSAAEAEGVSLDGVDEASIRFRDSMRDVEQAHRDSAAAIIENGGTLEDAQAEWNAGRDAVLEMLQAKGLDIEQAKVWADQNMGSAADVVVALSGVSTAVNGIPKSPVIDLSVTGTSAVYDELMRVQDALRAVTGDRSIRVATGTGGQGGLVAGNENGGLYSYREFANGGLASGIYPGGAEIHKFAERTLPWEAYISPKSDQRQANQATWLTVGDRLGFSQPQQTPSGRPIEVNTTINALPGMSPAQVARIAEERMSFALRGA